METTQEIIESSVQDQPQDEQPIKNLEEDQEKKSQNQSSKILLADQENILSQKNRYLKAKEWFKKFLSHSIE